MTRTRRIAARLVGIVMAGVVCWATMGALSAAPLPSYADLLAQAKQDASAVDFAALRYAYAESAQYSPYDSDTATLTQSMMTAYRAKDCAGATNHAQALLEKNYVRINAHIVSTICHRQLAQARPAAHHDAMARGLINSILGSGDGKTAETAFVVIAVDEEYSTLSRLGLKSVRQRLVKNDGHQFDVFEVTDEAGRTSTVFFNVDRPLAWLGRQIKGQQ